MTPPLNGNFIGLRALWAWVFSHPSLTLLGIGALARLPCLGWPAEVVFDEVHWGRFFSGYFTHQYYFDIHPPLGKLLYAGWAALFGFTADFVFESGVAYPASWSLIFRGLPFLAGSILPLVVFGLAKAAGLRFGPSFMAGLLIALDSGLINISRFMLLDPFLLLFGFAALWRYECWRKDRIFAELLMAGALAGLAVSIKWTGLSFLGLIVLREWLLPREPGAEAQGTHAAFMGIGALIIVPISLYVLPFWIHFALLTDSGPGDAFMSAAFQAGLRGNVYALGDPLQGLGFLDRFLELNRVMYRASADLHATHPYSSKWYTWPFMVRPVCLWYQSQEARIYLFGNPLIWWGSTAFLLTALQWLLRPSTRRLLSPLVYLFLGGWAMNFLPFIGIGRLMFLYHYLPALVFAVLLTAALMDRLENPNPWVIVAVLGALVVGVYYSPVVYGVSVPWTPLWRTLWV